jgi:hypothetical protein
LSSDLTSNDNKEKKALRLIVLFSVVLLVGGIFILFRFIAGLVPLDDSSEAVMRTALLSPVASSSIGDTKRATQRRDLIADRAHPFANIMITGRVFDRETSRGIHGARVSIKPLSDARLLKPSEEDGKLSVTTGPAGYYAAQGVPPGAFEFLAEASGYMPTKKHIRKMSVVEDDEGIDFGLRIAIAIEGRVIDQNGKGIADASLIARENHSKRRISGNDPSTRSDKNGFFLLDPAPASTRALFVLHPEYAAQRVKVAENEGTLRKMEIVLKKGMQIEGTVRGPEGPIEHATVRFELMQLGGDGFLLSGTENLGEAKTDNNGHYRLTAPLSRKQRLVASAKDHVTKFQTVRLDARQLEQAKEENFELTHALTARGQVLLENGKPAIGARLFFSSENGRGPAQGSTDKTGHFTVSGLAKAAGYRVAVYLSPYPVLETTLTNIDRPLLFRLSTGASVSGFVVNKRSGEAVSRFQYAVSGQCGFRRSPQVAGASGRFEIKGLDKGLCTLRFSAAGYAGMRLEDFKLLDGENKSGLRVALQPGASIMGRIKSWDKAGFGSVHAERLPDEHSAKLKASFVARISQDGSFLFQDLPPGRYHVRPRDRQDEQARTIELGPGEVRDGVDF